MCNESLRGGGWTVTRKRPPRLRRAVLLALAAGSSACQLTEVATTAGEDVLVVEAELRVSPAQPANDAVVLLHRSLNGRVVRGEPEARVSIVTPEGRKILLLQRPLGLCAERLATGATDSLRVEATCYTEPNNGHLTVRPGSTYELRVLTRGGERLRGRTTVPGDFGLRAPAPERLPRGICRLEPGTNLPLVWSVSAGAWSYLSSLEINGLERALQPQGIPVPDRLELTGLSISARDTTLTLPAEFGVFEAPDLDPRLLRYLQGGLPAGVTARLVVAAVDRNFVNAVRGGNFNPSGTVRISSVVGDGTGVFGSLVPLTLLLAVGDSARAPYPPCLAS